MSRRVPGRKAFVTFLALVVHACSSGLATDSVVVPGLAGGPHGTYDVRVGRRYRVTEWSDSEDEAQALLDARRSSDRATIEAVYTQSDYHHPSRASAPILAASADNTVQDGPGPNTGYDPGGLAHPVEFDDGRGGVVYATAVEYP